MGDDNSSTIVFFSVVESDGEGAFSAATLWDESEAYDVGAKTNQN